MKRVDAIVIGSGQGGVPFAVTLANEGKRVVLFERERFGGSCINWGCTPTKAFLAAAHAAGHARDAAALGVHCQVNVDFAQVMERVRYIREEFSRSTEARLRSAGVELVLAEASFTTQGDVQGGGLVFSAPVCVIDTGSSPASAPIPGLESIDYLTDRNFWNLIRCPQRTLVIGAGYIALELGQGLARLGSDVHLIVRGNRVLSTESEEVSKVLDVALQRDGVTLHRNTQATHVSRLAGERVALRLDNGQTLDGDAVLVAIGRRPNTDRLNAAEAGISLDQRGYIRVNEHLETSRPGIYAIGEVANQPAFTHVSWEDHRRLLANLRGESRTRDDRVLAYAMFTEPQVGRAGLSVEQAKRRGLPVREAHMAIRHMNRAIEWGHDLGFFQLLADPDTDHIVGATLVGYEAAELVHILVDLMEAGATASTLEKLQHIHPTYAENLPSLARKLVQAQDGDSRRK